MTHKEDFNTLKCYQKRPFTKAITVTMVPKPGYSDRCLRITASKEGSSLRLNADAQEKRHKAGTFLHLKIRHRVGRDEKRSTPRK